MNCDCSRRDFLRAGSASLLGMLFSGKLAPIFAQEKAAKAKACIFLFMYGGPSHIDTWDPKRGNGEFKAIGTDAGFEISEHLPKLAKVSKKLAVVRSMTSPEVDHGRGAYYLRTGYVPQESVEHPTIGSIFAKEMAKDDADVPPFVAITPASDLGLKNGPGYLGETFAPFVIDSPGEIPTTLSAPQGMSEERFQRRLRLLEAYEKGSNVEEEADLARSLRAKATRYMKGPMARACDLSKESDSLREQYGKGEEGFTTFGQACLTARRLVESGVKFVEITLEGWDTHEDNFNALKGLCGDMDAGFSSLARDLDSRGLLDSTLLVWAGEFGRTPQINEQAGRDHYGQVFSTVLAGGGVKGGQVVGASSADGGEVKDRPVTFPDLMATAASLAGLDPNKQYKTSDGRPVRIVDKGSAVKELIG